MHHKDHYKLSHQLGSLGMHYIIFLEYKQTRVQIQFWLLAMLSTSQIKNYICYL